MLVLGIETSCDETGVALYDKCEGLLAHTLHSQIPTHSKYGGVVPELASRDHIRFLIPILNETLKQANRQTKDLNAIAYTAGPGLIGALLTGATFAKSLSFALRIPSIAINHLEAHLLAAKLDCKNLDFPFLVLLVSGGHTQLIKAISLNNYEILGETVDDAAGEAFDKTAKLLGIKYPGGPLLAKLADNCDKSSLAPFPRPMLKSGNLDFSFSGLKTHALTVWQKNKHDENMRNQIAKSFQDAVVDTLTQKCKKALNITGFKKLVIAGGVGANLNLRNSLKNLMHDLHGEIFFPKIEFCTDNGAMVAYTGFLKLEQGLKDSNYQINVKARWPFNEN